MYKSKVGFEVTKRHLDRYWTELLDIAEYRKVDRVDVFHHFTKLKYRRNIFKLSRLEGTYTDEPKTAPLARNEDIEGVWFGIYLFNGKLPEKSPYGNHMIQISVADMMKFMTLPTPLPESDYGDDDQENESAICEHIDVLSINGNISSIDSSTKTDGQTPCGDGDELHPVVLDCNENVKEPENLELCKISTAKSNQVHLTAEIKTLLYFECAFYHGCAQYVRFVLIRSDNPHVDWCESNLKCIDLNNNPFCRWDPVKGHLYTIRNDFSSRRNIYVEVKIVGDILFESFITPPEWKQVGRAQISSCESTMGVFSRKN